MSSSKPKTAIFLNDSPEIAEKKIKTAKTGGKENLDEQREYGGNPEECVVYETLLYHLIPSDNELKELYYRCTEGNIMCGECKLRAAKMIRKFFQSLLEKRDESRIMAENILNAKKWMIDLLKQNLE